MSCARLTVLLHRFGVDEASAATVPELRAAYLRKARQLHPDAGGRKDGADFVRLKRDHDQAQQLLARRASLRAPASARASGDWGSPPPGGHWHWHGGGVASRTAAEPQSAVRPGPPPAMVWIVGGGSIALAVCWSWLRQPCKVSRTSEEVASACAALKAGASLPRRPQPEFGETVLSGYYSQRVRKAEPGAILQRRPHAKQRGSLYISPVHAAAEDGKAEWLHWVGERSPHSLRLALDRNQQTPLHYAARAGRADTCAVLLKFRADPGAADARGRTPRELAQASGNAEVVQMLQMGAPGPLANNQFRKKPSLRSQNDGIMG